jgi:glutamyl-tRNA synthetase
MDWGNAIVRSKEVDASGTVTSITMDLNLEGDFRKTKKKITWLSAPTAEHPLPAASLVDFDYLITKKKLEEGDEFADFVTPVTEFKEEVYADANILHLRKGDIIQFERKGYYIYDGAKGGVYEFFLIPDGRAASIASKSATAALPSSSPADAKKDAKPAEPATKISMYHVDKVAGDVVIPKPETKMYEVKSLYD